jgi:sarcosine oxidase
MQTFDLIVVGAGVTGASTAYHAARTGKRVLLLEQFRVGHHLGSSHGPSRILRLAYTSVDYVRLSQAAYAEWREVEDEAEESLFARTGGLDFATAGTQSLDQTVVSLRAAGVPLEELSRQSIGERFPQFNLPDDTVGLYQPDAGVLHADRSVAALVEHAIRHGATLRECAEVKNLIPTATGVFVETTVERYSSARVVLAAGSWLKTLAEHVGIVLPLRVTKEQVAFFRPRHPELFSIGRFPVMIEHNMNRPFNSGFPMLGPGGVKLMIESKEASATDTSVDNSRLSELKRYAGQLLPDLDGVIKAETCRYTLTPDEDFILDRHPVHSQIVIASPCSGHGFKFGPLFGHMLTDLAFNETARPHPLFKLDRPGLKAESPTA